MSLSKEPLIIVDIESTCWKLAPPPGEQSEIIEVGVCLFDQETNEYSGARSILVRPERSKVSQFCTRLTSLTQQMVNGGLWFSEACDQLKTEYQSRNRVWLSWGNYDLDMFQRQCTGRHIEYPFGPHHINLKTLFGKLYRDGHPTGMASALRMLDMPLIGTHHRGLDDTINIARILARMFKDKGPSILTAAALS
jgi:inhibitor of KinA sporulation pathway (predicted exonuclease)